MEHEGKQYHEGHKTENYQGHGVVDEQHHHHNAHNHHGIFHQSDQHIGKHHGNGVGVIGNTGHQLAHGDVVQLLVRKALNMGEHIFTKGRQKLLTDFLQKHGLNIHTDQGNDQNGGIGGDHPVKGAQREAFLLYQLLNVTNQHRGGQVIGDGDQHHHENNDELLFIGLGIVEKPLYDLTVGGCPLPATLFLLPLHQQIGGQENGGGKADDGAYDQNG